MKKLHKLILKSFIGPFIITFLIAWFILIMQFLWKYVDDLMGKGLDWLVIAKLMFYASANLVPMALPLAILLSSIMTFGNLSENNELTALKSAGLSLARIMTPLIFVIIFLSGIALFFSNNIWPAANLKMHVLIYDIQRQKPTLNIKAGSFYKDISGYAIKVKKKDKKTDRLYTIRIYDNSERYVKRVINAKSGIMSQSNDSNALFLVLDSGNIYEEMNISNGLDDNKHPMQKCVFERATVKFDLSAFQLQQSDEGMWAQDFEMLNLSQLSIFLDSMKYKEDERIRYYMGYLHKSILLFSKKPPKDIFSYPVKSDYFSTIGENLKIQILDIASKTARNNKNFVEGRIHDFDSLANRRSRYLVEWHRKFTLAFACLIMFFIGAPLGAIIKKGGLGLPIVFSVLFFIVYYVLSISGEKMAQTGAIDAAIGMWQSAFVLVPIGIFLTYKATTDSALFDRAVYVRFFKFLRRK